MKKLFNILREFQTYYKHGNCLNSSLKRFYEQYLCQNLKNILNEVTSKNVRDVLAYDQYKRKLVSTERFENFQNGFKRIKNYDYELDTNRNKIPKPAYMTHLFDKKGNPCTKQEFEKELFEYDFDEQSKAKQLLNEFLKMFRDSGWLDLESLPKNF